jgi:hypothetical protein
MVTRGCTPNGCEERSWNSRRQLAAPTLSWDRLVTVQVTGFVHPRLHKRSDLAAVPVSEDETFVTVAALNCFGVPSEKTLQRLAFVRERPAIGEENSLPTWLEMGRMDVHQRKIVRRMIDERQHPRFLGNFGFALFHGKK